MRKLVLDARGIPTGAMDNVTARDGMLGDLAYDDGFALDNAGTTFSLSGGDREIAVEFGEGYPYAQVYAPKGQDLVALEPMTAPINALVSGKDLPVVRPGERFTAKFRVAVS